MAQASKSYSSDSRSEAAWGTGLLPRRSAVLGCPGRSLPRRSLRVPRLLWAAVVFAVAAVVLGVSGVVGAGGLAAQEVDPQPESSRLVAGQQSVSSVPAGAVRLYYNCTEFRPARTDNPNFFLYSDYTRVFSSRNQSSCSGYVDGDYVLRVDVVSFFADYGSGYLWRMFNYELNYDLRVVGEFSWVTSDRYLYSNSLEFDLYESGVKFVPRNYGVSGHKCFDAPASNSLMIDGNAFTASRECYVSVSGWLYDTVGYTSWLPRILSSWSTSFVAHVVPPRFKRARPPSARVVRLEVTQGVQDWNNSLTLVRNRRTVVRAFMESNLGEPRDITAKLKGRKSSADHKTTELGVTNPVNSGMSVRVSANVAERRGDIDASLNFVLPEHWTDLEADERLRLELVPEQGSNVKCLDGLKIDPIENRCVKYVEFTEVFPPEIVMVPVPIKTNGSVKVPSSGMLTAQVNRLKSALPFANLKFSFSNYFKDGEPLKHGTSLTKINEMMQEDRDFVNPTGNVVYLGVVMGSGEENNDKIGKRTYKAGEAYYGFKNGRVGSLYIHDIDGLLPELSRYLGHERNIVAHELGHILGLRHPGHITDSGIFKGMCGEVKLDENDQPIDTDSIRLHDHIVQIPSYVIEYSTFPRPGLGPLGNENSEVWGVDTRYVGFTHRGAFSYKAIYDILSVIDPNLVFSLMSQCWAVAESAEEDRKGKFVECQNRSHHGGKYAPECEFHRGGQGSWLDSSRHEYLIRCLSTQTCLSSEPDVNVARAATGSSEVDSDLLSGSILFSSDGTATSAVIDSVFSKPRSFGVSDTGEYAVELRDASGVVLRSVPFSVLLSADGHTNTDAVFSVLVPSSPDYDTIAVVKSGVELAVVRRSLNAPVVSISGVAAGQQFKSGDSIDLSWPATDADGDELSFKLFYSTDGGNTYRVLSRLTASTSKTFRVDSLEGSTTARIGVSVSDGTRSSFSQTPVFSVAQNAPQVQIETPSAGAVFAEDQGFLLEASGYDTEDGGLGSSAFSWSSSIDGNLGTGSFLVQSAADLTPGAHTIAVTATDSDNTTATATVNITIAERNMLPAANDDEVFGGLEETLVIDVLANDIDTEGDFDLSSLAIDRHPTLGIAEIAATEMGMPVIEYSPITGGEETFTYSICDGLYRCDTAQVTVVFPDCTIVGSRNSDNLVGTSGDDVICGLDGDDIIDGKGGNDLIYAGFGEDLVYGRTGDDTIYGGPGNDMILGHRGDDTIYGGLSNDRLWGGGGDDLIYGGAETDEVYGEADDDTLYGGDGPDTIHGGRGNDVIYGGNGDDTIRGNAGADMIFPGAGSDTVLGNSQADTLID